jgi:uncharacterized protein YybS (DUF2232 family)
VQSALVVFLTITTLLAAAVVASMRQWRAPDQPRPAVLVWRRRQHSPGVEVAIEVALVAVGCLAASFVAILSLWLLLAVAHAAS